MQNWGDNVVLIVHYVFISIIRFGYLDNISLVGTAAEESGGYFPDILDMLEEIPILNLVSQFKIFQELFIHYVPT